MPRLQSATETLPRLGAWPGSSEPQRLLEGHNKRLRNLHLKPVMKFLDVVSTRHPQHGQDVSHETEYDLEETLGGQLVCCAGVSQVLIECVAQVLHHDCPE